MSFKPNSRLTLLLIVTVISFVCLMLFFFWTPSSSSSSSSSNSNSDGTASSSSSSSSGSTMKSRKLEPAPPVHNNNNIADDPSAQFFSMAPHVKCPDVKWPKREVAKHATEQDLWILVRGYVLNVTKFVHSHPGGVQMIKKGSGGNTDAADLFASYHQPGTVSLFAQFCIGILDSHTKDDVIGEQQ